MGTRGLLCLLAATPCLVMGSTPALASSGNAAATQAYVQANYALVRVARSHLAPSEAGPLHVLAQVESECPRAGAQSPQDSESTQMSDEVIGTIVIAAAQPDLQAIRTFVHAASGLSWSNHGLTSVIRTYVGDLKTVLSLSAPSLCSEVKAWAADGFHALPTSTVTFVAKFIPAWVALGFLPAQLSGYESSAAKALAKRSGRLEQQLAEAETRAVAHYDDIMNTLAIWP
jgi:hypothetical protein